MRVVASMMMAAALAGACGSVPQETPDAPPGPTPDAGVDGPPAPGQEICTPSTPGAVPADEDSDGKIDEDCAWQFGPAHWLSPLIGAGPESQLWVSAISADGTHAYLGYKATGAAPFRLLMATRAGAEAPFGAPVAVAGDGFASYELGNLALSRDELSAIVQAAPLGTQAWDLYTTSRPALGRPFAALQKLTPLSTDAIEETPFLRADGLEVVYSSGRKLKRALRPSPTAPFGPPQDLDGVLGGDSNAPNLSLDGRTLFYYHREANGPYRIYRAERSDASASSFGTSTELAVLEPSGTQLVFSPVISEATREIFFASGAPWTPGYYGIWRAQVCRDGACDAQIVPCTGGVRSPDNLHCYKKLDAASNRADAETSCAQLAGHLASVHSQAEQDLIWSQLGGIGLWLGGFDDRAGVPECNSRGVHGSAPFPCPWGWESGEPWTFVGWDTVTSTQTAGAQEPQEFQDMNEDCLFMNPGYAGRWADVVCANSATGVCETVLYPTW